MIMNEEMVIERLFQTIVSGDRRGARQIVAETQAAGITAERLALRMLWPTMEMVNTLFRADQLTTISHHYATRLLRSIVDQTQARYVQKPRRHRTISLYCGPSETEELAGILVADLAEADGYDVYFAGGGVAADEILAEVAERGSDILLMFASAPGDAPGIRQLIDTIRGVNACPNLQIVVGGGVFKRADGLAEEIGADLWAHDPEELLEVIDVDRDLRAVPHQRTVGRNRQSQVKAKAAA
jgi:methanogenic corrinoid protein MtbC1